MPEAGSPSGWRRIAVLGGVAVALAVPALLAPASPGPFATRSVPQGVAAPISASPPYARSSSWYCAGPGSFAGTEPMSVDVAGSRNAAMEVHVSWISDTGTQSASSSAHLPPGGQVALSSPLSTPAWEGADLEVPGGSVAAWEAVGGKAGESVTTCLPFTATSWYFAGGDADGSDRLIYLLYNPTATDAVADMSFADAAGYVVDPSFQGVVVPAGRMAVEDVSTRLFAGGPVGTSVVARVGRLVAYQVLLRPPSPPQPTSPLAAPGTGAVAVTPGVPGPSLSWYFPEGTTSRYSPEHLFFYDPRPESSVVRVSVGLDAGSAAPLVEKVPGYSVVDLSMSDVPSMPEGIGQTISLTVLRGRGVVAFQSVGTPPPPPTASTVLTTANGGSASPWVQLIPGVPSSSRGWLLGGLPRAEAPGPIVAVENPGTKAVFAEVGFIGSTHPKRVEVPAGGHALVTLSLAGQPGAPAPPGSPAVAIPAPAPSAGARPVFVSSAEPVVAEAQWVSVSGIAGWLAVPGVASR